MNIRLLFLFPVIMIMSSCQSILFQDTVGIYVNDQGFEKGTTMVLKSDSTFEYRWQAGIVIGYGGGKWMRNGNKIILNSFTQKDVLHRSYIRSQEIDTMSKGTRIKAYVDEDYPVPFTVTPYYKGTPLEAIDSQGSKTLFFNTNYDSLRVSFFISYPITIRKSEFNTFELVMVYNDVANYSSFFENDVWRIADDVLTDNTRKQIGRKMRFEKIR